MKRSDLLLVVAAATVLFCLVILPRVSAQSPSTDWEKAAGGKMSFDVASVKQNLAGYPPDGPPPHSNFPMDSFDHYSANGGLFSATNWPTYSYIGFAYKLTSFEFVSLRQQLPKWCSADHFDIEARAQGNPSKDQMRLMMQSLLADRFKLSTHMETRQIPVYDLVLVKAGQPGPNFLRHSEDMPCGLTNASATASTGSRSVPPCGMVLTVVAGHWHLDGRGMTLAEWANYLKSTGDLDRTVLDQTQLGGVFDFTLDWRPEGTITWNGATVQPDENEPTFVEALREQLGLKLNSATGSVGYLAIDHIEEPTPN